MNKTTKNQELARNAGHACGKLHEEKRVVSALINSGWSLETIRFYLNYYFPRLGRIEWVSYHTNSTLFKEIKQRYEDTFNITVTKSEYLKNFNEGKEIGIHTTRLNLARNAGHACGRLKEEKRVVSVLINSGWSLETIRFYLNYYFPRLVKTEWIPYRTNLTLFKEVKQRYEAMLNITVTKPEYLKNFNEGKKISIHNTQRNTATHLLKRMPFTKVDLTFIAALTKFTQTRLREMQRGLKEFEAVELEENWYAAQEYGRQEREYHEK